MWGLKMRDWCLLGTIWVLLVMLIAVMLNIPEHSGKPLYINPFEACEKLKNGETTVASLYVNVPYGKSYMLDSDGNVFDGVIVDGYKKEEVGQNHLKTIYPTNLSPFNLYSWLGIPKSKIHYAFIVEYNYAMYLGYVTSKVENKPGLDYEEICFNWVTLTHDYRSAKKIDKDSHVIRHDDPCNTTALSQYPITFIIPDLYNDQRARAIGLFLKDDNGVKKICLILLEIYDMDKPGKVSLFMYFNEIEMIEKSMWSEDKLEPIKCFIPKKVPKSIVGGFGYSLENVQSDLWLFMDQPGSEPDIAERFDLWSNNSASVSSISTTDLFNCSKYRTNLLLGRITGKKATGYQMRVFWVTLVIATVVYFGSCIFCTMVGDYMGDEDDEAYKQLVAAKAKEQAAKDKQAKKDAKAATNKGKANDPPPLPLPTPPASCGSTLTSTSSDSEVSSSQQSKMRLITLPIEFTRFIFRDIESLPPPPKFTGKRRASEARDGQTAP